jgi:RND family efflux transporter MFP subunit
MSFPAHSFPFGPFLARLGVLSTTLLFIATATVAVIFGSQVLQGRAAATALPEAADPIPVAARDIAMAEGYTRLRRFTGQVEPARQIEVSFELSGRMIDRPVDEGAHVREGQEIARLDTELLMAEQAQFRASRAALAAQLAFAESQLDRAKSLRKQGFSSVESEDRARAARDELKNRIIETDAALTAISIRLEKSVIRAPFSGRVGQLAADPGSTLAPGQTVMTLFATANPQVRVGLPLGVSPDNLKEAEIVVGSERYVARLLQVRPDVDPRTRTRTALFSLQGKTVPAFGELATLIVPESVSARGAWVPIDALKEGDGGAWTVLVVESGRARNAAVEVVEVQADRVFVQGGLTEGMRLVAEGAHRVVAGQSVGVLADGD